MSPGRTRVPLAALYFLFYLPSGLLKGSLVWFLLDAGVTLSQSGIIVSSMFFGKLALSPIVAAGHDRTDRKVMYTSAVAATGILGSVLLATGGTFRVLWGATLMVILARNYFQSLMDASAARLQIPGGRRSGGFGSARFAGSIAVSAGVGLMVVASLTPVDQRSAFAAIVAGFSALYFVAVYLTTRTDHLQRASGGEDHAGAERSQPSAGLRGSAVLVLVAATLLIGTQGAVYSTGSVALHDAGVSETGIQVLWCLAFASEAVAFYFSAGLLQRIGRHVIGLTLAGGVLRWLLLAIFPASMASTGVSFLLQGFVFAVPQAYFVTTIHRLGGHRWAATVQSVYIGVTQGIGIAAFSLLTQATYAQYGPMAWLVPTASTLLGGVAWVVLWNHMRRTDQRVPRPGDIRAGTASDHFAREVLIR